MLPMFSILPIFLTISVQQYNPLVLINKREFEILCNSSRLIVSSPTLRITRNVVPCEPNKTSQRVICCHVYKVETIMKLSVEL